MIVDHIGFFFSELHCYSILRGIGRIAAPLFFFCFVEGYNHTHNKVKYKKRLLISSVFMFELNIVMLLFFQTIKHPLPQIINPFTPNMFFTFFIMFEILEMIDTHNYKKIIFLLFVPFMEYNFIAFFSILILKYISNKKIKYCIFIIINTLLCIIMNDLSELYMLLSVLLLLFYNEEKGQYNSKLFYIIYPLHFYLLAFAKLLILH